MRASFWVATNLGTYWGVLPGQRPVVPSLYSSSALILVSGNCEWSLLIYLHSCDMRNSLLMKHTSRFWIRSSPEIREDNECHIHAFPLPHPRSLVSLRKEFVNMFVTQAFEAAIYKAHPLIAWLWWPVGILFMGWTSYYQIKFLRHLHPRAHNRNSRQMHPSPNFPQKRPIFVFKSCCLNIIVV